MKTLTTVKNPRRLMTSVLQEASASIRELHSLCMGMRSGSSPDPYSVLGIQADLIRLHMDLGLEMAQKFGSKESAYLSRKIAEANQYRAGRKDVSKKIADVTNDAILAVGEETQREIDSAVEYESYRTMLRSIQNALDYARSVVSFVKTAETSPSQQ
jgi:hypothetical protein